MICTKFETARRPVCKSQNHGGQSHGKNSVNQEEELVLEMDTSGKAGDDAVKKRKRQQNHCMGGGNINSGDFRSGRLDGKGLGACCLFNVQQTGGFYC